MKALLRKVLKMDMGFKTLRMETSIKVHTWEESSKEKGVTIGIMDQCTKESSKTG
jgi:hypothetical protein